MTDNQKGFPGLRWVRSMTGGTPPTAFPMAVASGYTGAINGGSSIDLNVGDPVKILSDGTVSHSAGSEGASSGERIFGVVVGIMPYYDGSTMVFNTRLPYNTVYGSVLDRTSYVLVWPAAGNIWEIDVDDVVTATTEAGYRALIGENCDHILTTGSEPRSNCLLDISTHVTSTAQWRIQGISKSPLNVDFSGAYVKLYVTCNETQQAPYVTTGI